MKRIKRRMAGIILIVMLLTILLSPGSFSAWADKTDDAADDEFDISAIIDNGDDVIVAPAEDSADPIVPDENITDEESPYKVGDIITFGKYEQDGDIENGKEDIEWQVLKVEEDRVLVVSKYALDCQPYNNEFEDVTWETCSLRKWLNNDFLNEAFSQEEQAKIKEAMVTNEDNPSFGAIGGNDTVDYVFCLSSGEVKDLVGYSKYNDLYQCGYNQNLIVQPTQQAINNGVAVFTISESDYEGYLKDNGYGEDIIGSQGTWWWLRSPGYNGEFACNVSRYGYAGADYVNRVIEMSGGVRPAVFLNIASDLQIEAEQIEDPILMPIEEIEDNPAPEETIDDINSDDEIEDGDGGNSEEADGEEINVDPEDDGSKDENSENPNQEDSNSEDVNPEDDNSTENNEDEVNVEI